MLNLRARKDIDIEGGASKIVRFPSPSHEVTPARRKAAPFVKWVGGKRSIMTQLRNRMPSEYGAYWEPFVGGGALFFDLAENLKSAHLSDLNMDLILAYKAIQQDPEKLIKLLREHERRNSSDYFYSVRALHEQNDPFDVAARILYLNKTCFNGLWRVNKKGHFNAPFGDNANPNIVQAENIRACHDALQGMRIQYGGYDKIDPAEGDFVYFDPPYHPTTEGSFTSYATSGFSEKDQAALAAFATKLHKRGVKVMLSNSNTSFIRGLFKSKIFKIDVVDAPRLVNCKPGGRGAVEEVIVTNY